MPSFVLQIVVFESCFILNVFLWRWFMGPIFRFFLLLPSHAANICCSCRIGNGIWVKNKQQPTTRWVAFLKRSLFLNHDTNSFHFAPNTHIHMKIVGCNSYSTNNNIFNKYGFFPSSSVFVVVSSSFAIYYTPKKNLFILLYEYGEWMRFFFYFRFIEKKSQFVRLKMTTHLAFILITF